jgi:hypothetical protein
MLHPKKRVILAWVRNMEDLKRLCQEASSQFSEFGRTPVLAFTPSRNLVDQFEQPTPGILKNAKSYLLLYQLSSNEEYILHQVGIESQHQQGFQLNIQHFNTVFTGRIGALQRILIEEIHKWRRTLHSQGYIAYPMRPTGKLKPEEKDTLFRVWRYLLLNTEEPHDLYQLDGNSGAEDEGSIAAILQKMKISPNAQTKGFREDERAMLFSTLIDGKSKHHFYY